MAKRNPAAQEAEQKKEKAIKRLEGIFPGQAIEIAAGYVTVHAGELTTDRNFTALREAGLCRIDMAGKNLNAVVAVIQGIFHENAINKYAVRGEEPYLELSLKAENDATQVEDRTEPILRVLEAHKDEIQAAMAAPQAERQAQPIPGNR